MSTVVDWTEAPEGCIGALVAKVGNSHFPKVTFVKYVTHEEGRVTGLSCDGSALFAYTDVWLWEDRPWTGEGLPPVGTVCEARIPHVSGPNNETRSVIWIEGRIIAYHTIKDKTYAWFAEVDGFYPPGVFEFRPIRTPEQIAADEREAVIKEMVSSCPYPGSNCTVTDCTALYDAGYRKQASND